VDLVIRTLQADDVDDLAAAFASWPKPRSLFEGYAARLAAGDLDVVVAVLEQATAGFLIIEPKSGYPPFTAGDVPEIADFNVLPHARGRGVGTALMDEAERRVGEFSSVVGLGVGLYADYGAAQRLYVRRGYLPDGAGVVLDGVSVAAGTTIRLDDEPMLMLSKQLRND
jgi:GNAT superfamily N-acetyltransferase